MLDRGVAQELALGVGWELVAPFWDTCEEVVGLALCCCRRRHSEWKEARSKGHGRGREGGLEEGRGRGGGVRRFSVEWGGGAGGGGHVRVACVVLGGGCFALE